MDRAATMRKPLEWCSRQACHYLRTDEALPGSAIRLGDFRRFKAI